MAGRRNTSTDSDEARPRKTDAPTLKDYRALAAFRYYLRRYVLFAEQSARAERLSQSQYLVLLALKGAPDAVNPTVGYLAERLGVRHHSAVGLIDRMATRGLVRREGGQSDQREVFVYLTGKGARLLRAVAGRNLAQLRSTHLVLTRSIADVLRGARSDQPRQKS